MLRLPGGGQPIEMRFENTHPRHLLEEVMLLNCRYDSTWLRSGKLCQPVPSVRASWSFACSYAACHPFVRMVAGLRGPMFGDQVDAVEMTAQRY